MQTDFKNEEQLLQQIGRRTPMQVPEGYFDALPSKVMERVQHNKHKTHLWQWAAAAVITGIVCTIGFYHFHSHSATTEPLLSETNIIDSEYMEEILDCNMVNNQEIENFLSDIE